MKIYIFIILNVPQWGKLSGVCQDKFQQLREARHPAGSVYANVRLQYFTIYLKSLRICTEASNPVKCSKCCSSVLEEEKEKCCHCFSRKTIAWLLYTTECSTSNTQSLVGFTEPLCKSCDKSFKSLCRAFTITHPEHLKPEKDCTMQYWKLSQDGSFQGMALFLISKGANATNMN